MALVLWGMRIKSPAIRHRAWTGVLHVMIFLPVLSLWVPRIPIPILPSTSTKQETQVHSLALSRSLSSGMIAGRESAGIRVSGDSESSTSDSTRKQSHTESRVLQLAIVVYFLGFCFFAVRLLTGMLLSYRLGRNALRNDGGYYYSRCTVPLTIGLFRTRILLPIDSKHWNPKKLEAVLAHESEHVQRHDSFVAWLALLNRCIYWFHPIAWWLCGKLNALAEQVCDERVLSGGHDCSAYAEYILEFARSIRQKSTLVPLGGSHFHGGKLALRIRRIMMSVQTPKISRGRLIAVAALCVFATLVPAVGKLARAIEAPPRLIPELSTAPDSLSQPNQMRAQEVPTEESNQPNAQQGTLPPDVEAGHSQPGNSDSSDESLYETGLKLFERQQYKEARQVFEKLIDTFPSSRFGAPSLLAIADSFYNEGGTENRYWALRNYYKFLFRFPTNPKADEVELKTIILNNAPSNNAVQFYAIDFKARDDAFMKALIGRDRYKRWKAGDGIYGYDPFRAEEVINRFIQKYPDSDLVPIAKQALLNIKESVADGYFRAAGIFFDVGRYSEALSRLKTIIDKYPNFSRINEARQWVDYLSTSGQPPQETPQK